MRPFILILLLLVPLTASAYETLVGAKVWLPANNAVKHFATDASSAPEKYRIEEKSFVVEAEALLGKALPGYQVSLGNGKKAYLYRGDLERLVETSGVYLHPPGTIPEDYVQELARLRLSAAPVKGEVAKASLKQRGAWEGRLLFLRQPSYGLPGLSAVKVRSVAVKNDGSVTLTLDTAAGAIDEEFENTDAVRGYLTTAVLPAAPAWEKTVVKAIHERKLLPGMTKEQVVASWGTPDDFNRTITKTSADEQWFYGMTSQLYFENDVLKAWKE